MSAEIPKIVSYSALATFLTCRRKYYLERVRRITTKYPPVPLLFGNAIHKALDCWYKTHDIDVTKQVFTDNFEEVEGDSKRTYAVGCKLLELYADKYAHEPFTVLRTEQMFTLPIPDTNFSMCGKIDKIIDWDGAVYVMDHKTTSRLGYEFFYNIKPNMQFDTYIWGARQIGYPKCSNIFLDALLVAKGLTVPSQLAKLTPLARLPDSRTDEEIEDYVTNLKHILVDLEKSYTEDIWYSNTESCTNYTECPYRRICKEDKSIQERVIAMDYQERIKWEE